MASLVEFAGPTQMCTPAFPNPIPAVDAASLIVSIISDLRLDVKDVTYSI